jgi:beta-mannosidase
MTDGEQHGRRTTSTALRDGWSFRQVDAPRIPHSDTALWLPAIVPGHVHADQQRNGVIPDPFSRMYERAVQWVDEVDWVYRCIFDVAPAPTEARRLLHFAGLDTVATIRLNGAEVGRSDNMFVPVEFDVTDTVVVGENLLEVEFASAQRVGDERLVAAAAADEEIAALIAGRSALLSRSMVRKAQYMYGWDWGPQLRSCGIWQDVYLVTVPVARIDGVQWSARFEGDDRCVVRVVADLDGPATEVSARIHGHGIDLDETVAVSDGQACVDLVVDGPKRWWPAGHGEQPLYDLSIAIGDATDVVDERSLRVGLREIELVREPDEFGESFFFRVNGTPIFAKGANWIPDHSLPSQTTRARVRDLVDLARGCGMNMLRIWGGGLYESEDFYDACDELGILVWQDFPYACAYYPDDDATCAAAAEEAIQAVRRLRNHTSLALWCGNNENQWLHAIGAYGKVSSRLVGERLYDSVLPEVVAAEDPGRPYWPGSPFGSGTNPSGDGDGDCHDWNVWHGEGDWVHYVKCQARFISEFGFSAAPAKLTLEEVLEPADLGVDTPGMRWHDKTGKGYGTYLGYIGLHYPDPQSLDDLVYYSQLNQADAMRFGIEHFRRLRPRTMGTLAWQLNDCWPVQSWAWVDHRLRPKAVWYAARRFYGELLLSLVVDGGTIAAHLVNDGAVAREGSIRLEALDASGGVVWSNETPSQVSAMSSVEAIRIDLPPEVVDRRHELVVRGEFGEVTSNAFLCEPRELRLPVPTVQVSVTGDGASCAVVLTSDVLALRTMVSLDGAEARWSDNFLDLLPGQPVELVVTPERPIALAELEARLRTRSLCTANPQRPGSFAR